MSKNVKKVSKMCNKGTWNSCHKEWKRSDLCQKIWKACRIVVTEMSENVKKMLKECQEIIKGMSNNCHKESKRWGKGMSNRCQNGAD